MRPSIPLWVLFVAVQAADVLWGVFVLTGIEHARLVPGFTESNPLDLYDMPYSHGLLATVVWSVGLGLLWRTLRAPQKRGGEALIVGLAVASHFVLDLVVHVPDLPVLGALGAKWGLGLWRHREAALGVECGLFVGAASIWWQRRENRRPRAAVVLSAMCALLVASYYLPTPPALAAMVVTGLAIYAACAFGAWWGLLTRPRPAPVVKVAGGVSVTLLSAPTRASEYCPCTGTSAFSDTAITPLPSPVRPRSNGGRLMSTERVDEAITRYATLPSRALRSLAEPWSTPTSPPYAGSRPFFPSEMTAAGRGGFALEERGRRRNSSRFRWQRHSNLLNMRMPLGWRRDGVAALSIGCLSVLVGTRVPSNKSGFRCTGV